MWQNSKTQNVIIQKLKGDKTQSSKSDNSKFKIGQNSKSDKTLNVTKLKNSICDNPKTKYKKIQ